MCVIEISVVVTNTCLMVYDPAGGQVTPQDKMNIHQDRHDWLNHPKCPLLLQ